MLFCCADVTNVLRVVFQNRVCFNLHWFGGPSVVISSCGTFAPTSRNLVRGVIKSRRFLVRICFGGASVVIPGFGTTCTVVKREKQPCKSRVSKTCLL